MKKGVIFILFIIQIIFLGCQFDDDQDLLSNTTPENNQTSSNIKKIVLNISKNKINLDTNTTYSLKVFYKNGEIKKIPTNQIEWIIKPKDSVIIKDNYLIAKKDGNVTIIAKIGNTYSNPIILNIFWEVDGHILPPEPDPKVNNATLLGVDVNHNGVRDDVERWIYKRYSKYYPCRQELDYNNSVMIDGKLIPSAKIICEKTPVPYHPAIRAAMMDVAKAAQIIIQDPTKAKETIQFFRKAYYCAWSVADLEDKSGKKLAQNEIVDKNFEYIQFNTAQRARAYAKFNYFLSGGVYWSPSKKYVLENWCSDNVKELIKGLKK